MRGRNRSDQSPHQFGHEQSGKITHASERTPPSELGPRCGSRGSRSRTGFELGGNVIIHAGTRLRRRSVTATSG